MQNKLDWLRIFIYNKNLQYPFDAARSTIRAERRRIQ